MPLHDFALAPRSASVQDVEEGLHWQTILGTCGGRFVAQRQSIVREHRAIPSIDLAADQFGRTPTDLFHGGGGHAHQRAGGRGIVMHCLKPRGLFFGSGQGRESVGYRLQIERDLGLGHRQFRQNHLPQFTHEPPLG
jgi:hypothetical protein